MDELEISGKRYISSVRAAKEHKYHSDYIGQLVRGGKVVGQKVGRAWYVDADSLAEYLGKEVPARGPIVKKTVVENKPKAELVAVGPEERPLTSISGSATDLSSGPSQVPEFNEHTVEDFTEPTFIMPLRKSGRSHVIAAIDDAPVTKISKPIIKPVEEKISEMIVEVVEEEVIEEPQPVEAEETFIPLKISSDTRRDIYAEPEDSFYKVSHKGLRYVEQHATPREYREEKIIPTERPSKSKSSTAGAAVKAFSFVLVAGILALGAGILMSYYLHSVTTVQESGQTSGVLLSN